MTAPMIQNDGSNVSLDQNQISCPLVVTLILNTNHCEDTLAALKSAQKNTYPNQKLIVLDNGSIDGSVEAIKQAFPQVQVVALEQNLGYAGNNNVGIKIAINQHADWVFILNEDIVLAPDCLEKLMQAANNDNHIGILGPMVYHFDEKDVIQSAGGKIDDLWRAWHLGKNELDQGQFQTPQRVDWISGCAILIRKEVLNQIGALDERFFYYWEETELCIRANLKGWGILQVPHAKIWHKGVIREYHPSPNVTYYNTRNHLLLMKKHHASFIAWVYTLIRLCRTFLSWTLKPKFKSMYEHRSALSQGVADFLNQRWGARFIKGRS